jgi:hypothetical protein
MNTAGVEKIKKVSAQYRDFVGKRPITESQITERVMRLGIEAKLYSLEFGEKYEITDDLRAMAICTLKEDQMSY